MKNKTSIVILTYNNLNYTKDCIESIKKFTKHNTYEIIIIDNLSTDGTREWLLEQKDLKVILNDENLGFPKGCNQGIEIADSNNDILLLNNDTIVTENWLKNLKICLYSDSKIGAVGSVCNHDENLQECDFFYNDFETMQKLALKNNVSDSERWEEKIFLIGFCILIKREIINKIKNLDENYSLGYIEDNDLSLRIIDLGYKLMLCHDSFIHHYLGSSFRKDLTKFYPILDKNRIYFQNKWGFNTFCFDDIKNSSIRLIEKPKKILELNCGIGVSLLKLKYMFKDIIIHGVEIDKNKYNIAKKVGKVFSTLTNIEDYDYDYILIGNILETIKNPEKFIIKLKKYLKDDGYIIGEISNASNIKNIINLLNDSWYVENKDRINNFTITDINELFSKNNYKNGMVFPCYIDLSDKEKELVKFLDKKIRSNYNISYYSFKFQK